MGVLDKMSDVDRRRWRDDRDRRRDVSPSSRNDVRGRSRSPRKRSPSPRKSKRRSRSRSDDRKRSKSSKHSKQDKKKKQKKKKKKRSQSSSSDSIDVSGDSDESGADSDSSTELLMRLEKERLELREKRKRDKERLKATETAEEKRTRRLIKKEQKANRDKERMGWDNDYVRYTNEDNPFGDSSLMSTFRWDKKLKQDGMDKLSERELHKIHKVKQEEQRQELEKVKQRRLEREREREERDQLMELEDRKRDEDKFHLQQARLRSQIRISDGRAKPIDLLAKYIAQHGAKELDEEGMDAVETHEPYTYLNGLALEDLEDLLVDIEVYVKIDLNKNKDFWSDIVTIIHDELSKLRKMERTEYEEAADRRQGINTAVAQDVQSVFKGKTAQQLSQLQPRIEKKLDDNKDRGGSGIDVSYWELLLSQLKAHLARARLRDKHSENLRKKLAMLKAEQKVEASSADDDDPERAPSLVGDKNQPESGGEQHQEEEEEEEEEGQAGV